MFALSICISISVCNYIFICICWATSFRWADFLGRFSKTIFAGWVGLWLPGQHVGRLGGVRQLRHGCFHQRGGQSDRGTCLSSRTTWHPLSFNTIGLGLGLGLGPGVGSCLLRLTTVASPALFLYLAFFNLPPFYRVRFWVGKSRKKVLRKVLKKVLRKVLKLKSAQKSAHKSPQKSVQTKKCSEKSSKKYSKQCSN